MPYACLPFAIAGRTAKSINEFANTYTCELRQRRGNLLNRRVIITLLSNITKVFDGYRFCPTAVMQFSGFEAPPHVPAPMNADNTHRQYGLALPLLRCVFGKRRINFIVKYMMHLVVLAYCTHAHACPVENKAIPVTINERELTTEIASSRESHMCGLAHRQKLAADRGMLFVYNRDRILSFWMKNTHIPLSIAYLDSERRIREIYDMDPATPARVYTSKSLARYALEVNQGWFSENGITVGDIVEFDPQAHPDTFSY